MKSICIAYIVACFLLVAGCSQAQQSTDSPPVPKAQWEGFLRCIRWGRVVDVRKHLQHHPKLVSAATATGESPLLIAARWGQYDTAELLLEAGANPNQTEATGKAPLHEALEYGRERLAVLLVEHGAKVNAQQRSRVTPLHIAAYRGFTNVTSVLISKGAQIEAKGFKDNCTPLQVASLHGRTDVVKALLERGADIHAVDMWGETALMCAAGSGHAETVRYLLDQGAKSEQTAKNGKTTALSEAEYHKHADVVKILKGRSPNKAIDGD